MEPHTKTRNDFNSKHSRLEADVLHTLQVKLNHSTLLFWQWRDKEVKVLSEKLKYVIKITQGE